MDSKARLLSDVRHGFVNADHRVVHFEHPELVSNSEASSMLGALRAELESLSPADSFIFSVAFVTAGGIGMIKQQLVEFGGHGTIITSDYLDFNDPDSLRELLALENVTVRIMDGHPHHAKGYIFRRGAHITALIGSSNLTRQALTGTNEWNIKFSSHRDGDIADQLDAAVQWQLSNSEPLTEAWIREYETRRRSRIIVDADTQGRAVNPSGEKILPNLMQVEALENIRRIRDAGETRSLIISATGTGKTILSALAAREAAPRKMLFVAHREQILNKAAEEFQRVMECSPAEIGFFVGQRQEVDRRFVFATVQSLSQPDNLTSLSPELFDLLIIDEVHRSGAASYKRILNFFRPAFALGLTATPERTDGFNIFELFHYNVAYEIRLEGALENRMLVPFDYYGVSDYQNARGWSITETSSTGEKVSAERVDHIVDILQKYSFARGTKGLIFCSSNEESSQLSNLLNQRSVHGRELRTVSLSGSDSIQERELAVAKIERGELDYIVTVDIFNEGIDIPAVNVVVMLRATSSSIVFTQQLGRGLRKHSGKGSLRVIDVIGNYAKNYLIPIALTGDRSHNKNEIVDKIVRTRLRAIAGSSTVSFDRVSMQRVTDSLKKARLVDRRAMREAILMLKYRLGRIPALIDFENHESMNPFFLASKDSATRNYWSLLEAFSLVERAPSKAEKSILTMLSIELLNGKRPQELLLLQHLLGAGRVSVQRYRALLESLGLDASNQTLESVAGVLNLSWFVPAAQKAYGGEPIAYREGDFFVLGERFAALYRSYSEDHPSPMTSFRAHVDDIIETGLLINRKHYGSSDSLIVGKLYSRKDASRLLNWKRNSESTIMGYKVDTTTATCPIFVTYHKDADLSASQRYEDTFLDTSTMSWVSRHGRTLQSKELQPILHGEVELHLFVKREDADGTEFYYLGTANSRDPRNASMVGNYDKNLDVVTTNLVLKIPVAPALFESITAARSVHVDDAKI